MWWIDALPFDFDGKLMETETLTWSEFHNGGKAAAEKIIVSKERNKSKRARLKITVIDPDRKVNYLCKFVWDRKITKEFTKSISSTRIGYSVLMMDVKSLWRHILADGK